MTTDQIPRTGTEPADQHLAIEPGAAPMGVVRRLSRRRRRHAPGLQEWTGEHHPQARAWYEALRAGRSR